MQYKPRSRFWVKQFDNKIKSAGFQQDLVPHAATVLIWELYLYVPAYYTYICFVHNQKYFTILRMYKVYW
jgi:hypothetical protein